MRQDVSDGEGGARAAGGQRRRVRVSRAEPGWGRGAWALGGGRRPSAAARAEGRGGGRRERLRAAGGLAGRRRGVPGPGGGSDPRCLPSPNSQRAGSRPRHEAAAGAGVREGVHSAGLQQWHALPVPDQVPRGAGEPGTQLAPAPAPGRRGPHSREGCGPLPASPASRVWAGAVARGAGREQRRENKAKPRGMMI